MKRKRSVLVALLALPLALGFWWRTVKDDLVTLALSLPIGATKAETREVLGVPHTIELPGKCFTPYEEWHYGGGLRFDPTVSLSPLRVHLIRCSFSDAVVNFSTNGLMVEVTFSPQNGW